MDPRRGWLIAAVVLALGACTAAVVDPVFARWADAALLLVGVCCAALMWSAAGCRERGLRGWRLIALSPLLPAAGALTAALVAPSDPLDTVLLRWTVAVPGYALAIAGALTLVDPDRLRGRGRRAGIELALFTTASLVTMKMVFLGPATRWTDLVVAERLVLGAAVLITSALMAGALLLLGVVESRRQRAVLLLLGGSVLLAGGRGLMTSDLLGGWVGGTAAGRFCVVAGLALGALAALSDPGRGPGGAPRTGSSTRLGQLLPHVAMAVGAVAVGGDLLTGSRPNPMTIAGMVLCVALATVHRWVTARDEQLMGARLRRSEAWFRSLVHEGGDAIVILDDDLSVTWSSPALARILGPAAGSLVGQPLLAAVHPEDAPALAATLPSSAPAPAEAPALSRGLQFLRLPDVDGGWRIFEAVVSDLRSDASVGAVVLHCRDVTDRHVREQVLHEVAYSDPMTGLPNRAGCELALQRAIDRPAPPVTLLLVELDGLAGAREHAGREVVRHVVTEIGRRLRATVRAEDLVARMGGGAFAVLAHGEGADPERDVADVDQLAARCLAVVEQPIMTTAGIVDLTAAVGVAALEPGITVEGALTRAELAVRAARGRAPGTAARWTAELGAAAARRERLGADLAGAAQRGELALLLDPIVSLSEQRVVGVEALLRWRHPVLGDVPSAEFLPLAERAGVAGELGRWVLREAMTAVDALPSPADPVRLGVDVSTGWAREGTLVADVESALRETGLAPERLILEITEATVLADDERIGLDLTTLRLMGVHVALEGYGTGYSGLTHLTRLPVDILKLDRTLVSRMDRDAQSRALGESMIGIGRALGLDVVAEGVETPAQLGTLCGYGYGFVQGFLIARPMPVADLATLLADGVGALWPGLVGHR